MSSTLDSIDGEKIFLLNRDHIISVATTGTELVVTTTSGKFVLSGDSKAIAEFHDELSNDVRSNFVSVPLLLNQVNADEEADSA